MPSFFALALRAMTQPSLLLDPFCHRGKTDIHSLSGIRDGVVLIDNQLSGFAFEFRTKISSFHWCTYIVLR